MKDPSPREEAPPADPSPADPSTAVAEAGDPRPPGDDVISAPPGARLRAAGTTSTAPAAPATPVAPTDDEDADFAELVQPRADDAFSRRASITGPPPERTPHSGAMLQRWGLLGRLFARLFFSRIFFPRESVETVRKAAELGTVVYVLRVRNTLEFLYFNYAFLARGLPLARFANGVRLVLLAAHAPAAPAALRQGERHDRVEILRRLTRARRSSALFLRTPPGPIAPADFEGPYLRDPDGAPAAARAPDHARAR